jgi:hypothetical protein
MTVTSWSWAPREKRLKSRYEDVLRRGMSRMHVASTFVRTQPLPGQSCRRIGPFDAAAGVVGLSSADGDPYFTSPGASDRPPATAQESAATAATPGTARSYISSSHSARGARALRGGGDVDPNSVWDTYAQRALAEEWTADLHSATLHTCDHRLWRASEQSLPPVRKSRRGRCVSSRDRWEVRRNRLHVGSPRDRRAEYNSSASGGWCP